MLLRLNDKGPQVSEVQKLLSLLGYDLEIDGHFGLKTQRSVRAFQKKVRLIVDGLVGDRTLKMLKLSQKRTAKEDATIKLGKEYRELSVHTRVVMPPEQYIRQNTEDLKKQIFIHFTAGGPSAEGVIRYWNSDERRVATAYVIDRNNGGIYEGFHPDYWSYHLGIKGSKGKLDKASIGIEICSYGPLKMSGGSYFSWPKKWTQKVDPSTVYKLDEKFRGYQYFQKYTDAQMISLEKLLNFLIKEYNIPVQKKFDKDWFKFNQDVIKNVTPGIWTHTTVRKDKSDSYPDHRLIEMLNRLALKYN